MLVSARITQGEHLIAPLVLQDKQPSGRSQLAHWVQQTIRFSRAGQPGHQCAALSAALNDYADHLAARIDAG